LKEEDLISSIYDFQLVDGAFDMRDGDGNFLSVDTNSVDDFVDVFLLAFEAATPVSKSGDYTVDFTLSESYCASEFYTSQ